MHYSASLFFRMSSFVGCCWVNQRGRLVCVFQAKKIYLIYCLFLFIAHLQNLQFLLKKKKDTKNDLGNNCLNSSRVSIKEIIGKSIVKALIIQQSDKQINAHTLFSVTIVQIFFFFLKREQISLN